MGTRSIGGGAPRRGEQAANGVEAEISAREELGRLLEAQFETPRPTFPFQ